MIPYFCEQYSPEWWSLRNAVPTASQAARIITPKTGQIATARHKYIHRLLAEELGIAHTDTFVTEWMQRGKDLEPEAAKLFELVMETDTETVGFVTNDDGTAGASADRLVSSRDSGLEIKSPMAETHIGYLLDGGLPDEYRPQVHMSMSICEVDRWFFMSYHPELDPLIIEVERDDYTEKVEKALVQFNQELSAARARIIP